jgi:hypothetical protein
MNVLPEQVVQEEQKAPIINSKNKAEETCGPPLNISGEEKNILIIDLEDTLPPPEEESSPKKLEVPKELI